MISGMIWIIGMISGDSPRFHEMRARSAGRIFGGVGGGPPPNFLLALRTSSWGTFGVSPGIIPLFQIIPLLYFSERTWANVEIVRMVYTSQKNSFSQIVKLYLNVIVTTTKIKNAQ